MSTNNLEININYLLPYKHQDHNQLIDVANSCFQLNDEYYGASYPKGAREKRIYLNTGSTCPFLIEPRKNNESAYYHNYLYKFSNRNFPEQFWVEVFAYRLGCLIGIEVPPAFVAIDSASQDVLTQCGAFIEWMYPPDDFRTYIEGGDFLANFDKNYDLEKGTTHNFTESSKFLRSIERAQNVTFKGGTLSFWSNMFLFDALIGNTDRHQNNWAFFLHQKDNKYVVQPAPLFDNGTSMGHEIINSNISSLNLNRYISRGRPHMKWKPEEKRMSFETLIPKLLKHYPLTRSDMFEKLKFTLEDIRSILEQLLRFDVPTKLSSERAEMMFNLISLRQKRLNKIIECV